MANSKEAITILNDLIQINNDRITGYERAMKELKDNDDDLKTLFEVFIDESRQNKMTLGKEVQALGGDMDSGTTGSGKIYRAWMDVKAVFTGHNRHNVLENCEFGEDAAKKAYTSALHSDELPAYLREMVAEQQKTLNAAHDEIKKLRDQNT
ncbi:MAG: ferritin-like domain-containing protein [Chitinophagaceae bacterium]